MTSVKLVTTRRKARHEIFTIYTQRRAKAKCSLSPRASMPRQTLSIRTVNQIRCITILSRSCMRPAYRVAPWRAHFERMLRPCTSLLCTRCLIGRLVSVPFAHGRSSFRNSAYDSLQFPPRQQIPLLDEPLTRSVVFSQIRLFRS